jgi:hypothetical protein
VAEVLGDLVDRAPFVEEQRGAGVAEVVGAEVRHAGALERGDPDASTPVLPTQVAASAVGEHELAGIGSTAGEVELDRCERRTCAASDGPSTTSTREGRTDGLSTRRALPPPTRSKRVRVPAS